MLGILGLAVIVIASVMAFKTARDYGRSTGLWTGFVIIVGLGFQVVIPVVIYIVVGFIMAVRGSNQIEIQNMFDGWLVVINVVCVFLSVVGMMSILKYLSNPPEEEPFTAPPAPPESFT